VGGWASLEDNVPHDVQMIAETIIDQVKGTSGSPSGSYSLVNIKNVESQVVAGVNYRFVATYHVISENQVHTLELTAILKSKALFFLSIAIKLLFFLKEQDYDCNLTVFWQPWTKYMSLTSATCEPYKQ
jgi:hypothetical protein